MSKSVFVCSRIPGLLPALRKSLPNLCFDEIAAEELVAEDKADKATEGWKGEILVADIDNIMGLIWQPKEKFAFVQATWAGIDPVAKVVRQSGSTRSHPSLPLCRLAHPNFSQLMSEYLVAHVINAERGFYPLYNMQRANQWSKGNSYRCLSELTIGILGVGEMGRDAAMRFKVGFGCRTLGLVRSLPRERCPHIDEYFTVSGDGGDDLVRLLKESDYLCSVLPNTAETTGILGGGILKACADKCPTLINIGRSNIVTETDLLSALDEGWIGGAVLDVFDKEPLSEGHAFWAHPKVVITPHVAANSRAEDIAKCFKANYERHTTGKLLENKVDWDNLY